MPFNLKKEACLCKSLERAFFIAHMKTVYKGNLACFIPVQVFGAGGQEPRMQQKGSNGAFANLSERVRPLTPTFQFMFF